jgi:hypothetical protein
MAKPNLDPSQQSSGVNIDGPVGVGGDMVGRDKVENIQVTNVFGVSLRWIAVFGTAIVVIGVAMGLAVFVLSRPPKNPCQVSEATFDFESQTTENWAIRDEGGNLLGIDVQLDHAHACSPGTTSLAFHINLRAAPFDKAQLKYEALGLLPPTLLSGYVYVPSNAPDDLQASCFALENNANQAQALKPPWPWYQSNSSDLKTGQWNLIQCAASDFIPRNTGYALTQPLLEGFEFRRKSDGPYFGTLYVDKITLK